MNPSEIKQRAALIILRSGMATVGEVAHLRGVSRQALQKATRDMQPRRKRAAWLKLVWKDTIKQLTG